MHAFLPSSYCVLCALSRSSISRQSKRRRREGSMMSSTDRNHNHLTGSSSLRTAQTYHVKVSQGTTQTTYKILLLASSAAMAFASSRSIEYLSFPYHGMAYQRFITMPNFRNKKSNQRFIPMPDARRRKRACRKMEEWAALSGTGAFPVCREREGLIWEGSFSRL